MIPSIARAIPASVSVAVCSSCDRPLEGSAHDQASGQHATCALARTLEWCQTLLAHSAATLATEGTPDLPAIREVTSALGAATESYERVCRQVSQ